LAFAAANAKRGDEARVLDEVLLASLPRAGNVETAVDEDALTRHITRLV
jgi:hypothetical protein